MKIANKIKPVLIVLSAIALFFAGWWFALPPKDGGDSADASAESGQEWTCSMHPQIRQPNPGLCPICNMDLIPLEGGDGEGGLRELTVSPEAAALLDLRVSPVVRAPADVEVQLFGKIDYDERNIVTTTARISGRLDRLYADFTGTTVSKGDAIAEIYSPELYVAQQELIQAVQSLKSASSKAVRDVQRSLLKAARTKLKLLEVSDGQIKAIEQQKKPSSHITLTAPQDGVIVSLDVREGQYVKTGDPLFGIARLDSVWLKMEAYESDLPWMRYAQDVSFTVEAVPGKTFHGRIAFIDPQLDSQRRVVKVRVNVENKDRLLKPGMFATATASSKVALNGRVLSADLAGKWISPMHPEIIKDGPGSCDICGMPLVPAEKFGFVASSEPAQNPLLVPSSAVLRTGKRAVVYVRIPGKLDPVFEGREIVLGPRAGHYFIVDSGLSEGELVVTQGAYKLDSELQIKARPSMMNPDAGLESRPANKAPEQVAGQWSPILRAYGKLEQAVQKNNHTAAIAAIKTMKSALNRIHHNQLQPAELAIWKEFSMRLNNTLSVAATMKMNHSTLAMVRDQMREVSRYTGLPSNPLPSIPMDKEWIAKLKPLTNQYLVVSKALSDDQPDVALKAAPALATAIRALPAGREKSALQNAVAAFQKQQKLKPMRKEFEPISDSIIRLVRAHGLDHLGNLYVIHCPMAFRNKGADWLSHDPKVRNPYFGDSMYDCGSVTDALSLEKSEPTPEKPGMDHSGH